MPKISPSGIPNLEVLRGVNVIIFGKLVKDEISFKISLSRSPNILASQYKDEILTDRLTA